MAYPYPSYTTGSYYPTTYQTPQYNYPSLPTAVPLIQNQNTFQWVQGEAGAKAYPVAAGNSVLLMDSESATIYWKSTDQNGRPLPLKTYDLVERVVDQTPPEDPKPDLSMFVKRDELSSEIAAAVEKEFSRRLSETCKRRPDNA